VTPAAGPAANFQLQNLLAAAGHDTVQSVDRSSIGDISIGATYQLLNTFGDTSAPAGSRHVRLAVNGAFRIGTGEPGSRNRFFDFGTGYGQPGVVLGAAADAQLTRRVSGSVIGSYTLQLGSVAVSRVPNAANAAFPFGGPIPGTYSAGNVLAIAIIPRYRLAGNFNINAQYTLLYTAADQYTLGSAVASASSDTVDITAPVQPTAPFGLASSTAHQLGLGFSYSTVAGPDRGPGRIPFEVSFNHLETIAASGGPVAKSFRDQIELRVYILH
jgi:hypothetical protein